MATILVVDDTKNIRDHMASFLHRLGHRATTAGDGREALGALAAEATDLVFSDVRMAGMDGVALLEEIQARWPGTVVVLMTAYATVPQAVEAIKAGAYDYLVKPFSLDELGLLIERALEVRRLRAENVSLRRLVDQPVLLESASPAMTHAIATARQAATSDVTVLLTGESGTGKNVLAAAMHDWSGRREQRLVTISCTTLVEQLLESELFGHLKGAFTGAWKDRPGRIAAAEGGTLFLDEIGDLPAPMQGKFLRFLQERRYEPVGGSETIEVDTRVIAATNRDLEADVAANRFRGDLLFRMNVITIALPPLRERAADLPALTDHLLAVLAARHRRGTLQVAPEARRAIAAYRWPGNVRELMNALEHAVVLSRGDTIRADDLPDRLVAPAPAAAAAAGPPAGSLEDVERRHIEQVLADSATLEEAAARLGINATTLWRKRKRYGME
jgi:two-component system, NtrC family, response regulator AlgB